MPKRNIELLKKVRDEVRKDQRRNSRRLDMSSWFRTKTDRKLAGKTILITAENMASHCGTTACIAGWASLLHGDKFEVRMPSLNMIDGYGQTAVGYTNVIARNGRRMASMQDRGASLLGLDANEAEWVFGHVPDWQALWVLNKLIAGWSLEQMQAVPWEQRRARRLLRGR